MSVHRYLALTVGFLFVLMGLSGSLNVFQPELDRWFNPSLKLSGTGGNYRSPDEMFAAIRAAHPRRYGAWTLVMPQQKTEMVTAWLDKPVETSDEYYAPLMVSVNPYAAEIVATRFRGDTVMTWILELHEELFMGAFGRQLIGCFGVLLVCLLITRLWLWWPRDPAGSGNRCASGRRRARCGCCSISIGWPVSVARRYR